MLILNTLVLDKDYSKEGERMQPIKRLIPMALIDLPEGFYGGTVTHIAESKENSNITYLITNQNDGLEIVDIAVKDITRFNLDTLKKLAEQKGIEFEPDTKVTKNEVIELMQRFFIEIEFNELERPKETTFDLR